MYEFIVWDKKRNKFMEFRSGYTPTYGNLIHRMPFEVESGKSTIKSVDEFYYDGKQAVSLHQYIGKKDINNNKIYADSSIVEFGYSVGDAVHIGYFYYDKEDLSYRIKILSSFLRNGISNKFKGQSFLFDRGMIDFKIIDTIQENKLGLIK